MAETKDISDVINDYFGNDIPDNIKTRFTNILMKGFLNNNSAHFIKIDDLLNMSMNVSQSNTTLNNMVKLLSSSGPSESICDVFVENSIDSCINRTGNIVLIPDVLDSTIIRDATNNISNNIVNSLHERINLGSLGAITSSDFSQRENHKTFIKDLCFEILKSHYKDMYGNSTVFQNQSVNILNIPENLMSVHANNYCTRIDTISIDYDNFNNQDTNDYFWTVYTELNNYRKTTSGLMSDNVFFVMFINCFYPYIFFNYIVSQIALINNTNSNEKAPRFFKVRRTCIVLSYLCEFTILSSVYKNCDINYKLKAEKLLESINQCLYSELIGDNEEVMKKLMDENKVNVNASKDLQMSGKNITLTQNNLVKAIHNDESIKNKFKNSFVLMWLWISLFIVIVITSIAFVWFLNTKDSIMSYYYLTVSVIFGIILVSIIIQAIF